MTQTAPSGSVPALETGDVARAISAVMRAEFDAPVAGLRSLVDILAEDADRAGLLGYVSDITKMRKAGERLSAMVSDLVSGGSDAAQAADLSRLRHDLRTPLAAIIGYAELLAEEVRENGDLALYAPLADVLEAAGRLLRELGALRVLGGTGRSDADGAVQPAVREIGAVVRQLSRRERPGAQRVGRVLVVDDNSTVREMVARRLGRDGHTVEMCGSGEAALILAATGRFDLMLLDLIMPGITGLDVLDRLRAEEATRDLPVIVFSALDESDAAVRCIEAGADDFLSKPLNETLLRARIASSLERKFLRDGEREAAQRLRAEQERSRSLLRNILPESVIERLEGGEAVVADQLDDVTVLFCDLVGFTPLSARLRPAETLDLLNEIFSGFDGLAEENGIEKIKTIGDAYMAVGGLTAPTGGHAARAIRMAVGMPAVVAAVTPDLSVRIGIETGPAVAGIIGRRKFFYDVWGATVNAASRLETTADSGRIHVSESVRNAAGPDFAFEERAPIALKGLGFVRTFYVA